MPLIHVSAPEGALVKKDQDRLMPRLSDAVLRSEGAGSNDPAAQALVWAYYTESPAGAVYVGGKRLEEPSFTISVTTPEGALDDGARKRLVSEIGSIVDELAGPFEGRFNHWAMLYEVTDGGWAGAGQIFRLTDIQNVMDIRAA